MSSAALAISVRWGDRLIDSRLLRRGAAGSFSLGSAPGADVPVPRAGQAVFHFDARGPRVEFTDGVRGEVLRNGETPLVMSEVIHRGLAVEAGAGWALRLGRRDGLVLRFGELTVEAWPTRAPTRVTAHHDGWDFRWLNVLLATGLGALLVLVHFELTALEDEGFDEDGLATAAVTLRQVLMTTPRPVAPRAPAPAERRLERERVTPGAPARGPATSARGPGGRTSARDGLRDLFRGVAGGGVFGEGGLSAQLTGAVGRVVGAAPGLGGLTLRGGGAGGDVGGPERIGALDWTPEGARGPSDVKLVKARAITPTVLEQPPDVADGCLDKERLRAVVREHLAQVRNCYEALLSRLPALEGRVVVTWHVTTAGVVDSAEVLSTPSPELGACLAGRILTWRFPAAQQAGAGFRVSYPFVFKRSGP